MKQLQIFFKGNDKHNNWIYFKTDADNIEEAIERFQISLRFLRIDLCDMQPTSYALWDADGNYEASKNLYQVDLRSRKSGNTVKTIFSGGYDEAMEVLNKWYAENGMDSERPHDDYMDGADGCFADIHIR